MRAKQFLKFCQMATVLVTGSLLAGCLSSADPHISMAPPPYVEELPSKESSVGIANPGSLFGRGENPLFADKKAMNVNDIVTVVISENANQTSSANKTNSKNSAINLGGGAFSTGDKSRLSGIANQLNRLGSIGFEAGGESGFSGSGSTSRAETFTTTVSARIIKILNNGNYFIEGSKEILINNEKQIMQLSGVIRPYDIEQNNTIESAYISDAKILYRTEGDLHKATNKPWGSKLIEAVWPF